MLATYRDIVMRLLESVKLFFNMAHLRTEGAAVFRLEGQLLMDVYCLMDRGFPFLRLMLAINPVRIVFSSLSKRFDLHVPCYGLTYHAAKSPFSTKSKNSISPSATSPR